MAFIRCEGLVKIYKAAELEVFALQGLDLEVAAGETLAIIGNSGSGKSTLLNILGALDQPTAGRCFVGEQDLLKLTRAQRVRYQREQVGFVWQNSARNLIPYLSAVKNVELPMAMAGKVGGVAHRWAMELLDAVGLSDRAHHTLTELSGGEQQRVSIALALANRPRLLLADEPTGAVDNLNACRILAMLRDVNHRYGTTVVIVTHDRSVARSVDRYVLIRDGKVAQEAVRRGGVRVSPESPAGDGLEELAVLDGTGRVQIPHELLERAGLKDRAHIEVTAEGVILRKP